jgi:hypothetical protein
VDKIILISSTLLGLLMVIIYAIRCWRSGVEFNHAVMINTIFQSSGIVCGVFLVASIFFPDIKKIIADIDIYIFVSGLAVFAVSIQGFYRDAIKTSTNEAAYKAENRAVAE